MTDSHLMKTCFVRARCLRILKLLRQMVEKTGAKSTDLQSPETVEHLCAKCDAYAERWTPKAEELFQKK